MGKSRERSGADAWERVFREMLIGKRFLRVR